MDLTYKDLKYINNTRQLPKFSAGWEKFKTRWNEGGGQKVMDTAMLGLDAVQKFNSMRYPTNNVDDFVGKYGTNNYGNIDGFNYQQYNDINTGAEENRMSQERDSKIVSGAMTGASVGLGAGLSAAALGATLGGLAGPVGMLAGAGLGALVGGIFGNSAKNEEEERMRIAQIKQNNANEFWRTGALSASLRNKALEQYGDTKRFNLFSGAVNGAERVNPKTGKTVEKHYTNTSDGPKITEANAKLTGNELIIKADYSPGSYVQGDPNKIDKEFGYLKKGESVANNIDKVPGTNMTFAQFYPFAYAMGKGPETLALQAMVRENKNNMKKGKLTHAALGLENFLATVPGMIQSFMDYKNAANDTPRNTNITPINPYEKKAAEIMAARRMSAYPQMNTITQEDAAQRYRINNAGGMSAMQKTMANITNAMGTKMARANALANVDQINNQFAKENAELIDKYGSLSMDANVRAQMFNEQQNAAANAARTQQMAMAKRNMLDYATQFAKNAWEKNQFDRMMELYWEGVRNDRNKNLPNGGATWSVKDVDLGLSTNAYKQQDQFNNSLKYALDNGYLKGTVLNPVTPEPTTPTIPSSVLNNIPDFGLNNYLKNRTRIRRTKRARK